VFAKYQVVSIAFEVLIIARAGWILFWIIYGAFSSLIILIKLKN